MQSQWKRYSVSAIVVRLTPAQCDGRQDAGLYLVECHVRALCHTEPMTTEQNEDDLDPALVAILASLYEAANDPAGKPWSLPKLAKRVQLPMSTLRRVLTQLDAGGLTVTTLHEDGTGSAALTAEGRALCAQLFDAG